jgi:hypothetical protein
MTPPERRLAAAIESLTRIRVADRTERDGSKVVWHQSAGAEIVSWVDPTGFLERQELTLAQEHVLWTREWGLRTGTVSDDGGSGAGPCSALVKLDVAPSEERLERARAAFGGYTGKDKYLLHLRTALLAARQGPDDEGGYVRTLANQPDPRLRRRRQLTTAIFLGVGLSALAAVALLVAFSLRGS